MTKIIFHFQKPLKSYPKRRFGQWGQAKVLSRLFNGTKGGFFVEAGAADGVKLSNTLALELDYDWTGLLVEANPKFYDQIATWRRNVFSLRGCLAVKNASSVETFVMSGVLSGLDPHRRKEKAAEIQVQCFPITAILKALGNPTVDLFSLDVEGSESGVLETIAFEDVDVRVFLVEYGDDRRRLEAVKDVLRRNAYAAVGSVQDRDFVFVRENVANSYDLRSFS